MSGGPPRASWSGIRNTAGVAFTVGSWIEMLTKYCAG